MAETPGWASTPAKPDEGFRFGRKGFMVLVASLAIITWTAWRFWDTAIITSARLTIWYAFNGNDSIRVLRSGGGTLEERLNSAGNLRLMGADDEIEDAIATLIATLYDEDVQVRATAAYSLGILVSQTQARGQKKPLAPEQVKKWREAANGALIHLLSDKEPDCRAAACVGLAFIEPLPSPPSTTSVAVGSNGPNKLNRSNAQSYFGFTDHLPPPELFAALVDESVGVRCEAARALARFPLGLDPVIAILLSMLDDSSPLIRESAQQALSAAWPTSVVVPSLIDSLKDPNRRIRYHAARLLGRVGPEANAAVPVLMAMLKEPVDSPLGTLMNDRWFNQHPEREAAIALGRIAPNDATIRWTIEVLSAGKPDEPGTPERWICAAAVLGEIGPPAGRAVPALIAALNQLLDSKKGIPGLSPMADAIVRCSPQPAYSAAAIAVLIRLLDPRYQSSGTRYAVVEILGRIGRAAAPAIPKLKELQTESDLAKYARDAASATVATIEADLKLNTTASSPIDVSPPDASRQTLTEVKP
jgi:HEAT repeat protein